MTKLRVLMGLLVALLLAAAARKAHAQPFAYVTNFNASSVSVIDTATNTIVSTIRVGGAPRGVAVTPDGRRAYVVNEASDSVSVIDTANNTVTATIGVGSYPMHIAIRPDASRLCNKFPF